MSDAHTEGLIEQAFEYRGYVTVSRHDGSSVVGFVYDRSPAYVEMFDEQAANRIRIPLDEIADITLTGEDSAAQAQRRWQRRRGGLESRDTSLWGDWEQRPTLILVAMRSELRGIARMLGARAHGDAVSGRFADDVVIARALGVGGGAAHVVAAERPRLVISCGFSGALQASLCPGDLVLGSSVCDETGDTIAAPEPLLRLAHRALEGHARVSEGEILCATRVAVTRDEKSALAAPGRLAIDLESWAVARAAVRSGIPWLAVRVVLDPLDVDLAAFTQEPRTSYVAPALRHALRGPRSVLELARLGVRAGIASRSLQRALHRLIPVLVRHDTDALVMEA